MDKYKTVLKKMINQIVFTWFHVIINYLILFRKSTVVIKYYTSSFKCEWCQ